MMKFSWRQLPVLIWMVFIFYLSSQQRVKVSDSYWLSFIFFKTLHLIEYAFLFLFWDLALGVSRPRQRLAFFLAFLYSISDEFHQHFVPTRHGCLRDVFIDALGIYLAYKFLRGHFYRLLGLDKSAS